MSLTVCKFYYLSYQSELLNSLYLRKKSFCWWGISLSIYRAWTEGAKKCNWGGLYFTHCNLTLSGFISSVDICAVLTLLFSVCLIPIEPVFHWVSEICKLQLEMVLFIVVSKSLNLFMLLYLFCSFFFCFCLILITVMYAFPVSLAMLTKLKHLLFRSLLFLRSC